MKIIKDNTVILYPPKTEQTTLIIWCDHCGSELEISQGDTHIGWLGAAHITCPCCKKETMVEEFEGIALTKDNIVFPNYFHNVNKNNGAATITDREIEDKIRKGIDYFREHKDEFAWYTSTGDLFLSIFRFPGDEEYSIYVTRDFYETDIPFEIDDK